MDARTPKPRVNGSMIPKYIGQYVCVIGKNLGVVGGTTMHMETSDQQKLKVHFVQPMHDPLSAYVEVVGKVRDDCSLTVERCVCFGADFDLEAYNNVVQLMSETPGPFPVPGPPSMAF